MQDDFEYYEGYEEDRFRSLCLAQAAEDDEPEEETPPTPVWNDATLEELMGWYIPPTEFLVEDILPVGLTLLSAPSKIGKSWMMLDLAISIASGETFLGRRCRQAGVIYLALEDSFARLQDRARKILGDRQPPKDLHLLTEAPDLSDGLMDCLLAMSRTYQDVKLIIIDTFQRVRGLALSRETAYAQDYREMGIFRDFCRQEQVAVLLVHHTRKMRDPGDPFNEISGTTGIMGCADTIWMLSKENRSDTEATFHVTGRDAEGVENVVRFDSEKSWRWLEVGSAKDMERHKRWLEYIDNPVVQCVKSLLAYPNRRWEGTAMDMMRAGKENTGSYPAATAQKLSYELRELEDDFRAYDGIAHGTINNGTGGKKHCFYYVESR
jgi:hypothetical protein